MKKTRTKILAGMALLVGVMILAGIVWAKAVKTPVSGMYTNLSVAGPPKDVWIDDEGIQHFRRLPVSLNVEGDLEGTSTVVVNLNINWATGNGDESGWSRFEGTWNGLTGTFEGRFSQTITDFIGVGHGVSHGTGDFEGMKLMTSFTGNVLTNYREWEGIILDPHGE
jgi:hypothetical protein